MTYDKQKKILTQNLRTILQLNNRAYSYMFYQYYVSVVDNLINEDFDDFLSVNLLELEKSLGGEILSFHNDVLSDKLYIYAKFIDQNCKVYLQYNIRDISTMRQLHKIRFAVFKSNNFKLDDF